MSLSYDPHDPTFLTEGVPFDHLARLRAEAPVCPTPAGASYLSRSDDVQSVLKEVDGYYADLGPMTGLAGVEQIPEDQWFLSEVPEPRHTRLRRLFNMTVGPHRTREIAQYIQEVCTGLVDGLLELGVADLHGGYAMPIPSLVMARALELPPEASDLFMEWSFDGSLLTRPASPGVDPGRPAVQAFFLDQLDSQRRRPEPTNRVLATFSEAEVDGRPLSDQEIVTQLHFMIQAGVHTTRGLLVHAVQRLLESADLFGTLQRQRTLVPVFVEESLRHDSPVQRVTRRCARDTSVGGVELPKGAWLEVGIASANRDETRYEDPEAFRLDRPDPVGHLAFGAGAHVCPGASLARAEAVTAVEVLLDRLSGLLPVADADYPPIPGSLSHQPVPAVLLPVGTRATAAPR